MVVAVVCAAFIFFGIYCFIRRFHHAFVKAQAYSNVRGMHSCLCAYLDDNHVVPGRSVPAAEKADSPFFARRNGAGKPVDEWGNEYMATVLLYQDMLYVSVRSGGPDGQFYTGDDIACATVECLGAGMTQEVRSDWGWEEILLQCKATDLSASLSRFFKIRRRNPE